MYGLIFFLCIKIFWDKNDFYVYVDEFSYNSDNIDMLYCKELY